MDNFIKPVDINILLSEVKVETVYGFCRCCLSEGSHREITKAYDADSEIYFDMILETFNLFLSTNLNLSTLICITCVERLRDAKKLKDLIMKTDKHLIESLNGIMELADAPPANQQTPQQNSEATVVIKMEVKDETKLDNETEHDNDAEQKIETVHEVKIEFEDSEYESGAPGQSTKEKLRTEILHDKFVTTCSRQDFKPSETQSTDNESRRLNKAAKSSAERSREFRARKSLLKQQSKQQRESEIATEEIRTSEIRAVEKRAKSAEATRRWRERKKGVSESSNKQAKTAAQRMRKYRERKKIAKKIMLKQQSDQDLDAIDRTSSQVNQSTGPSTNSISAELTRRGNSQSHCGLRRLDFGWGSSDKIIKGAN